MKIKEKINLKNKINTSKKTYCKKNGFEQKDII